MTLTAAIRGIGRYARRLASGDLRAWRHLPYQVNIRARGLDLSGVDVYELGLSEDIAAGHRDSGGPELSAILRSLPITSSDKVLDIGCGKGGAMLTLAKVNFARVDGIELSRELAEIATGNLRKARLPNCSVFNCDARFFNELDEYTYIYMYHPFPATVMGPVLENIALSAVRRPRRVTLIYKNPLLDELVRLNGFQKLSESAPKYRSESPFAIYTLPPAASMRVKAECAHD
jgi:predicted RNA methylase